MNLIKMVREVFLLPQHYANTSESKRMVKRTERYVNYMLTGEVVSEWVLQSLYSHI